MSYEENSAYPRVKIPKQSKAWQIIQDEAKEYGKSEGEFISDLAIAWTRMRAGEWNPYWPVLMANVTANGNGAHPSFPTPPDPTAAQKKREEEERKERERKEARLASARAELLE